MARRKYGARALTSTERGQLRDGRKRRLAMVDDFNAIVRMLSREDMNRFEASGILPGPFLAALQEQIRLFRKQDELNLELWQIATGECRDGLFRHELLALQCLRWENDRHRSVDPVAWVRWIPIIRLPTYSLDRDLRWKDAPANWAPRRWFTWSKPSWLPGAKLLQISIAGAPNIRAQLETEFSAEVTWAEGRDEAPRELVSWRKDPVPQGFWDVEGTTGDNLDWKDRKWEPYVEDAGPGHVVDTWKPKPPPKIPIELLRELYERRVARKRYWGGIRGRPVRPFWWGSRSVRKRLPDDDALDRLATSAAIEAGL